MKKLRRLFLRLNEIALAAIVRAMKMLSIEEAQGQFQAICEEALAGEVVRLQLANGAVLQLTPVPAMPPASSVQQLAQCYEGSDWAAFENHCAAASD